MIATAKQRGEKVWSSCLIQWYWEALFCWMTQKAPWYWILHDIHILENDSAWSPPWQLPWPLGSPLPTWPHWLSHCSQWQQWGSIFSNHLWLSLCIYHSKQLWYSTPCRKTRNEISLPTICCSTPPWLASIGSAANNTTLHCQHTKHWQICTHTNIVHSTETKNKPTFLTAMPPPQLTQHHWWTLPPCMSPTAIATPNHSLSPLLTPRSTAPLHFNVRSFMIWQTWSLHLTAMPTPNPLSTPLMMTTTMTRLYLMVQMLPTAAPPPPHHCTNPKAPSQPLSTHLATLTDPPDSAIATLEALQHQILCDMQDLDRILRAIPLPPPPAQSPQLHPCSNPTPSPPPATTAHDSSVPGPTPTRQLPQPHLTVTAHMILNNTRQNSTPWTPNALQRGIQHPTLKPCQLPHSPEPAKGPPTLSPDVPVGAYNSLATNYTNSNHTTALATSFPWQATCQHHYQHPPFIPRATNIKALAHNMQPP